MTPAVQAVGVRRAYSGVEALRGVSVEVGEGEVLAVLGPNGAGKTTLVRTLLGLIRRYSGEVKRARGLKIGYMPQRLRVDPIVPLTVRRFLKLNNRLSRLDIRRALKEVGAPHVEISPVQVISGGEFQRVLLARALLREPEILVLDEPAQGVDVAGQGELYKLIARLRDRYRCAVLMISQDLHLVMESADSVVCLNHHICCTGKPEAVSRHPEYLKLFGALRPGGLAVYTHDHDHRHDLHGDVVSLPDNANSPASSDASLR